MTKADELFTFWQHQLKAIPQLSASDIDRYARSFATNEVEPAQVPLLTHDMLNSMGIDKAGHRALILALFQAPQQPRMAGSAPMVPVPLPMPSEPMRATRCANHSNAIAVRKCMSCYKSICLDCVRERRGGHNSLWVYCPQCNEEIACPGCNIL